MHNLETMVVQIYVKNRIKCKYQVKMFNYLPKSHTIDVSFMLNQFYTTAKKFGIIKIFYVFKISKYSDIQWHFGMLFVKLIRA